MVDLHQVASWTKIKVVIFDVDGTLYSQKELRKKVLPDLFLYYLLRPWRFKELLILYHFRKEREKRALGEFSDLENTQYQWCAEKTNYPIANIKKAIDKWIFSHPNQYLFQCTYKGIHSFFDSLENNGVQIAIFSEYKAADKLNAMKLRADLIICSTDAAVDKLKPNPAGLLHIAKQLGVNIDECLFIGDREDKDGMCAKNVGMPYLLLNQKTANETNFYGKLEYQLRKYKNSTFYETNVCASKS